MQMESNSNMAIPGGSSSRRSARVTRPQITAMTMLTLVLLSAGVLLAALGGDFSMRAGDMSGMGGMSGYPTLPPLSSLPQAQVSSVSRMGNMIMPPGMIMTADMTDEQMRDMAAVDLTKVAYTAPAEMRGGQPLAPMMDGTVKVFAFDVSIIRWNILPNRQVAAYAFNRQVPGPLIRVVEGDRLRIVVTNNLPEGTSVHWHGLIVPNAMDGPAGITQSPIAPGGTFTYEFDVRQRGTYFYHSHKDADRQQALGMYGALIIDPKGAETAPKADLDVPIQLGEWTVKQGYTFPAMPMEGLLPNYFTINGKAYPATDTITVARGQTVRFRFIGTNSESIHPMHIHGGPFKIVETDGNRVPEAAQIEKDTVNVGPGERYDVLWTAREPGRWLLHCHINHHTTNDNTEQDGAGGLTMVINVTP